MFAATSRLLGGIGVMTIMQVTVNERLILGFCRARRAASLRPIDALRYE